ncbi:MAG: tyrosine-type recombinase/integrase [Verrucomicrobiales bacterium]|nr:tyrosine-type recombinase/integrase [Verrucomicrobiales bacterium]
MKATMLARVQAYLRHRRSLGYALRIEGQLLVKFARFADHRGHRGPPTKGLMLSWATQPSKGTRLYKARRLEIVRTFAKHHAAIEPSTEVPPRHVLGPAHRRTPPHIYTEEQIRTLMVRARRLSGGLRPKTYETLVGLIACTGLRISEALGLRVADIDFDEGVLTIRESKFRLTRLVPVHRSTVEALRHYNTRRLHLWPHAPHFLVSDRGAPLPRSTVYHTFRQLAGSIVPTSNRSTARIHDLRHTFACRVIERWERTKRRAAGRIAVLSRYLGHARVTDTYWYLTATPDLLDAAAKNFKSPRHETF